MKYKLLTIIFSLTLCNAALLAQDSDFFSVNGYGTLGGAYHNNDDILYKDSIYADKGSQGNFSFANYSMLGLQLDAQVNERLSFTLQTIASPNNERGTLIEAEWANAKYQLTDSFDIRIGLMRAPNFMYSDVFYISCAYDWIALPDMYGVVPYSKYTGIELSHTHHFHELTLHSRLLYGNSKSKYRDGKGLEADYYIDDIYGGTLKVLYKDLTFRLAYNQVKQTYKDKNVDPVLDYFDGLGVPNISQFIQKNRITDQPLSNFNIGTKYNFENSYLIGEYIKIDTDSFFYDSESWYIGGGYHYENWTPFAIYSYTHDIRNFGSISTIGATSTEIPLIDTTNDTFTQLADDYYWKKITLSLGLRYDINDNLVLKLQYDRQRRPEETLNIYSGAFSFLF